ncbi:MAG: helix-turn-helix domain-containing protein [Chitinophagales bacterium]
MPDFIYEHKVYYNPVEFALRFIGGTWKMPILWRLNKGVMRYTEIRKTLPHITDKMLSSQLRELERDGLVHRKAYAVVPPRVEYQLSAKGREVMPLIEQIRNYGLKKMKEVGKAEVAVKAGSKKFSA